MSQIVSFHRMEDATREEYQLLERVERQQAQRLRDAILTALMRLDHSMDFVFR